MPLRRFPYLLFFFLDEKEAKNQGGRKKAENILFQAKMK